MLVIIPKIEDHATFTVPTLFAFNIGGWLAPGEQLPLDSETDNLESWKNASQSQTSANGQQKLMPGLGRNNVANKKAKESSERTPMRVSERPPPHVKMKASCLQQE